VATKQCKSRFFNPDQGEERPVTEAKEGAGLPMPEDAAFLRAQAEKCRWLAKRVTASDVSGTLLQMAREYDERAAHREGEKGEDG
jgi:hypothetical protein